MWIVSLYLGSTWLRCLRLLAQQQLSQVVFDQHNHLTEDQSAQLVDH